MTLCSSDTSHIWIPVLLVYKAVELVFSLIFAFETRKVKVKELNDSKIIVFCVYTLVISAIALTPTTILLQNQPTAQYAVTGIVCLLTGTVLLAITFVPKVTTYIYFVHQLVNVHGVVYILIESLHKISPWFQNICICMNYHLLFWTLTINDGCIILILYVLYKH